MESSSALVRASKPATTSNALSVTTDTDGQVKYDALARRGHGENRIVHASFKDLIPLRHQAAAGELSLDRPSEEEVEATKERTQLALASLVSGAVAAQNPKNVKGKSRNEPTYVKYTPASQMGGPQKGERIMKIVERQQDPMEPPKFKHKKVPRGPPSPPPPIMRSPPRKLTAEDQEAWKIPPPISNWKNPKGYTVPLDKRLAADGRGLQDVTINDKFAQLAESLFTADRHAREEVKQRAAMQQKLAEQEKMKREDELRELAQKARAERTGASRRRSSSPRRRRSRTPSDYSSSESDSDEDAARVRDAARKERRRENERQMRQARMGTERKIQMMAREQNRDISEKVALGLAKPTQSTETMYDSRLFDRSSGFNSGFNEDNPYDKELFASRDALNSIYRPSVNNDDDDEDGGETMDRLNKQNRFDVLGKAKHGFKGAADAEARSGPVQFEKDTDDPFNINQMISEVTGGEGSGGQKRYGIEEPSSSRASKRARVDDE